MQIKPIDLVQGETKRYGINVTFNDVPLNISGGKFYFTIKKDYSDTDENAVVQIMNDTFTSPLSGEAEIVLPSTTTSAIPIGDYVYDIRFIDAAGNSTNIQGGTFSVYPTVTRKIV